jgi:CRP-like cAMP-binding protein
MQHPTVRTKKVTRPVAEPAISRGNLLLAALPKAEGQRLIARCDLVQLQFGQVLSEQGERIRHVYFPTNGFISLLSAIDGRPRLEVGLIGTEGMLGASLLLGVDVAPLRALVQGEGSTLRLGAAQFARTLAESPALEKELKRYLYVLMSQLAQMAACTRFHVVEARLARWLLMTRDRAHTDEFYLTQEFIAYMLGVRRAGITEAANALQKRKLIHYNRGTVTVLDARRLEAASCECYRTAGQLYARVMH